MRPFDKAILKLTAFYSAILLGVCLMFSVTIYSNAVGGFRRPPVMRVMTETQTEAEIELREAIEAMMRERDEEIQWQMLVGLIVLNACVLVGGVFVSYWLARVTLKPIDENMRAQEQFVSNASHELRTPLNTMRTENEVLRRDKSATKADYVALVDSNLEEVDKLNGLCTRLLSLSHNEKMEVGDVDIREIVRDARVEVLPVAGKKQIEIVDKTVTARMRANAEALMEILEILLDNAVKYSPVGSKITVSNDGAKICVSDQGSGVAEEDLPHIFERFYRAEKSHTTCGHGLGLALAQHLAVQQGLRIVVQNNEKKGTNFIVG